jgi:hypothetical protein
MPPNRKLPINRQAACVSLVFACLLASAVTASAQGAAAPSIERWRPRDGIYASPAKDFGQQCKEKDGDIVVDLQEKSVYGFEWSCKVKKLTDTSAAAIKLDMICSDLNMPSDIPNAQEREFKEILTFTRIDDTSVSVRKTLNGNFKGPAWRANYCPEEVQRTRLERKAEEKLKAAHEEMMQNPWRPKVGVYAAPGANFGERCLNGGEATIDLGERAVSVGAEKCSVVQIRDQLGTAETFVDCGTPKRPEIIIFRKLDDSTATILVQKTKNRSFSDAGEQLSYCGAAAQATYAQSKSKK